MPSTPTSPYTLAQAAEDADWVLQAQLPSGAITSHLDHARIWPYLANFAATGLVEASAQTGDRKYVDAAWRWLAWYAAHQDAQGFVADYDVSPTGVETSTNWMDSTDAYAGTFLMATRAAHRLSKDPARLAALRPGIAGAVRAIEATQDSDGLTWAKPSWRVKYLMDQAEALVGLRAGAELARALGDAALADRATAAGNRLQAGIASLWNEQAGSYDWAKHDNGARTTTDWSRLYPDALQQAWVVGFGLVPAERGAALMSRFEQAHPNWDSPRSASTYADGPHEVGYWAPVGWAFHRVGRSDRAYAALARIRAAAVASNRLWPFTPSDSGQLVVLGRSQLGNVGP